MHVLLLPCYFSDFLLPFFFLVLVDRSGMEDQRIDGLLLDLSDCTDSGSHSHTLIVKKVGLFSPKFMSSLFTFNLNEHLFVSTCYQKETAVIFFTVRFLISMFQLCADVDFVTSKMIFQNTNIASQIHQSMTECHGV